MSNDINREPAFPSVDLLQTKQGMTLRDYFAAKALPAIIQTWPNIPIPEIPQHAYLYADHMLKYKQEKD